MADYQPSEKNHNQELVVIERWFLLWRGFLLAVLLLQVVRMAEAQTVQVDLRCPRGPLNTKMFANVLAKQVELAVDPAVFQNVRARVSLRQIGRTKNRTIVDGGTVLSGLTISQSGLTGNLSGKLSYSATCDYPFVARVVVSGTDVASGARLAASTQSLITITSPGEFVARQARVVQTTNE
ncbi:MAG: hypothetical protein KDD70_07680 [Bdellovibrionales bacterium]|nr:hypothetical protein [Bdellovibrionales bacterium]